MGGSRGAKVDPKDYEPGEREKALAAIAVDANNYYVNHLQPVMAKQLKHAASDRFAPTVKGFRQADIQQAMTGKLDLDLARSFQDSANKTLMATKIQVDANREALGAKRAEQENALRTGLGLGATSSGALAQAARLQNNQLLSQAQDELKVRMARKDMQNQLLISGAKAATFGIGGGLSEMGAGGAGFKTGFKQSIGRYFRGEY